MKRIYLSKPECVINNFWDMQSKMKVYRLYTPLYDAYTDFSNTKSDDQFFKKGVTNQLL